MIYDIYQIGKATLNEENKTEALYKTDSMSDINYIVSLDFEYMDKELKYKGIKISEHNSELSSEKYLLRKRSSNGANFGPTAKKTDYPKTMEKKILPWFRDALKIINNCNSGHDDQILLQIHQYIENNLNNLCTELEENAPQDKKAKVALTVRLNGKYPMDTPSFYACYKKMVESNIVGDSNKISGTCCLCKENNRNLVPEVKIFKFYTKDKPGFISGGFNEDMFWRNCPVCLDCEPILREGKQYMLDKLRFRFYGIEYYILPSTTQYSNVMELVEALEDIDHKRFSFQKDTENEFRDADEDFFDLLKDKADINSFRILFFKQENSAERILLDMKDVFPSRFRELYDAKNIIRKVFENVSSQAFNFRYFRDFLSKTEKGMKNNDLDALFLKLTHAILTKEKITMDVLLPHYLREIRGAFHENKYFKNTVLKAWIGLRYLQEIGCMDRKEVKKVMEERDEKIYEYLKKYETGYDTALIQALIISGAFIQKVLNIQARNLNGSTPFESRLKGFKLRQNDVMGILAEGKQKMRDYDSFSSSSSRLYKEAVKLIGLSESVWLLTTDKINFYISAGMALSDELYEYIKEEK